MKQTGVILFLAYYFLGTFCLPSGNFSMLSDLPAIYNHCKTFEDKDMTPLDFITDHLINFDCLFDNHGPGDDQRPHQPVQTTTEPYQSFVFITVTCSSLDNIFNENKVIFCFIESKHPQKLYHQIFRPPIV
jgi:hypothetical protein